jgi:hypothetical protein
LTSSTPARPRPKTATFFLDDSGVKAAAGPVFVVGGFKIRSPGRLMRQVQAIRDKTGYTHEFKFSGLNQGSVSAYYALIDALAESDARLIACVTRRPADADWRFYANLTAGVVRGNVNRDELVGVHFDTVSTPEDVSIDEYVKAAVNRRLGNMSVVSCTSLDSRSSDGLQIADLIAGAVAFEHRLVTGVSGKRDSMKGRVSARLKAAFSIEELVPCRNGRVNVHVKPVRAVDRLSVPTLKVVGGLDAS